MTALSIGAVSGILGTVGSVVGVLGQLQAAQAQSDQYAYQAQIAKQNQEFLTAEAARATAAGQIQAANKSQEAAAENAQAGAAFAANNVTGKSRDDVLQSINKIGQQSANTVLTNAETQAYYGYIVPAYNQGAQANLDTFASQEALTTGAFKAAGSLIADAGSVFSGKWGGSLATPAPAGGGAGTQVPTPWSLDTATV